MKWLFFIVLLGLFTSCKTTNLLMEAKEERKTAQVLDSTFFFNPDYQYQIRKGDKVSISVWGQEELSIGSAYGIYNSNEVYGKWLLVDANGNIEIPKLGTTSVIGNTTIQLKDSLKARYSEWLIKPVVDIKVLNKEITVLGEVNAPQIVNLDKDYNTLLELITRCQGFDSYANLKYVKILRQQGEHVQVANLDLSESGNYLNKNIQLYPGDVMIVPSRKHKEFDKRVSTIIPFTTTISAAAILFGVFR